MELCFMLNVLTENLGSRLSLNSNTHATCCLPIQRSAHDGEVPHVDFHCATFRTTSYTKFGRRRFGLLL